MEFLNEIKDLAQKNPDEAIKVVEEGEKIVEEQTGHKFDAQIQQGAQALEGQAGIQQQGN